MDLEDPSIYDKFIQVRVRIPKGEEFLTGTIKRRKRDEDGNLIGNFHENPIFDTRAYEVEFSDGHVEDYTANILAEAMYSRCNEEGHRLLIMDEIIDHAKSKEALSIDDTETNNGKPRRTTKGWHLCVSWRDGTSSWHSLAELKEYYPVEIAEYAVNNKLTSEPAFKWWINYVLKKRIG